MRRVARDWSARAAIIAAAVGGTVWAHLEDAVPIVAVLLVVAGLGIAVLPLPTPVRHVQLFVTRVLLFGSVFEIGDVVLEDKPYEVREVLIIGTVFASIYAVWDHFVDEDDDAPASSTTAARTE